MLGSSTNLLLALLSAFPIEPANDGEAAGTVTVYCMQTKPTSVPGCLTQLSVTDTSLATGVWQATKIARGAGAGVGNAIGIFIYSHGVGIGKSAISVNVPMGTLCIGLHGYKDFQRSAPPCPAALLPGALAGTCNAGPMETSLNCNRGVLGIAVGEDVNVQFWYRDPESSGLSNLSNAIFYTVR